MNSIRWMPMIRWLKFPFRVHILHKTVQLSVHELRRGYVCMCVKACPTVPPSPWEQGGHSLVNTFPCFRISFLWSMSKLLWSHHYFVFSFKVFFLFFTQLLYLTPGSCFRKYVVCNSKSLHCRLFNDQGDTNNFLSVQNRKPQFSIVKILVKFQHGI